jgi:hypothetical protein
MTEEEWLHKVEGYFPREMLYALDKQFPPRRLKSTKKKRERKLRLFGCAACRRIVHLYVNPEQRRLIDLVEEYADGEATGRAVRAACEAAIGKVAQPQPGQEWSSIYGAYDYASKR